VPFALDPYKRPKLRIELGKNDRPA